MQTRYMEKSSSMAREKRGLDATSADEGHPDRKRPALASVIVEALKVDSLQKLCSSLEPILRRVVSEEVERALAKLAPTKLTGRSSPKRIEGPDGRNLQLQFRSRLSLPLFTGGKVEGEQGAAIHIVLMDANTGLVVTSGPESSVKLDVIVLEGDFNNEDDDNWTQEEFESHVVKEREGKRPLLTGDLQVTLKDGVGTLGELTFTDNSSWIRSRKFRLGLKVASGYCEATRIREAKTEAFTVKDHRGELYKKHYPPALHDDVWRLEKIGKDGSFHKRLNKAGIYTVEDFLKLVVRDSQRLRNILGSGMSNKMWDVLVEHAKTCVLSGKLYVYYPENEIVVVLLFLGLYAYSSASAGRDLTGDHLRLPSEASRFFGRVGGAVDDKEDDSSGIRWAVLIAGSNGYWNYRHQADICHAYQLLRQGGLKDENIVVFMYDDIAFNEENPRPGVIINKPDGHDVYNGVPKDYTGDDVTVDNFFAVLLGNRTAITGGSGKVVDSGPNDHIFVYYSDHGGPGVLGMPTNPFLYAEDLIEVLKKKHASGTYKSLVFYLEACESGSIFEGLLPEGLNIYATTAANAEESSWGTYCPGDNPSPPPEYETCLGDLYSVAWMEDSDIHNMRTETLHQQYELVKTRTASENYAYGSHVMQYGDIDLSKNNLFVYIGTNPANDNYTYIDENFLRPSKKAINQRDADLVHFWDKFRKAPEGSPRKVEAQKQFVEAMSHRMHVDESVKLIGKLLFGIEKGPKVLNNVRPAGQPLVDDWGSLKTLVRTFETHCGSLSQYGMKHMRAFANICNAGILKEQMADASAQACVSFPSGPWSSLHKGFSA